MHGQVYSALNGQINHQRYINDKHNSLHWINTQSGSVTPATQVWLPIIEDSTLLLTIFWFERRATAELSRPAALLRPVTVTHLSQQSAFTASHGVLPRPGVLSIKDSTLLTPVVPAIKSSVRENDSVSRCRPSLSRWGKFSPEATFPRAKGHMQLLSLTAELIYILAEQKHLTMDDKRFLELQLSGWRVMSCMTVTWLGLREAFHLVNWPTTVTSLWPQLTRLCAALSWDHFTKTHLIFWKQVFQLKKTDLDYIDSYTAEITISRGQQ